MAEGIGTTIDRYKLLDLLGEGGFGTVYWKQGRHAEAAPLMIATWQSMADNPDLGPEHPYATVTAERIASIYVDWGKPDEAEAWVAKALDSSE